MANVTIEETDVNYWTASSDAPILRAYYSKSFTAADGTIVEWGNKDGMGVAYKSVTTTLLAGTVTIPSFTIISTRDGVDYRLSRISFHWFTSGGTYLKPFGEYTNLAVDENDTTVTFADLKIFNSGSPALPPDSYYNKSQTLQLISDNAGLTVLSGDVTTPGGGSAVTTIANDAVTFAKMQNISTSRLLGRSTASSGDIEQISLGSGLNLAAGVLSATGAVSSIDGLIGDVVFTEGSSGSDFNIAGLGSTVTFNIPDAGASARGVMTTGAQSLAGAKTFTGVMTHIGAPASDTAQGSTTTANLFRGADSSSGSPLNSNDPSVYLQTFRTGGSAGVGMFGYNLNFNTTGVLDGNTYGLYLVTRLGHSLTGTSDRFHEGIRSYMRMSVTGLGSNNVVGYAFTANAERTVTGVRAVGYYVDQRNSTASDAAVSTGVIDTMYGAVFSHDGTSHNTGEIYFEGPSNATSSYFGLKFAANSVCQRVLDLTVATATLQGSAWTATAASNQVTIASGGHADVEVVAGDWISVNGVYCKVASATANAITLTGIYSSFGGAGTPTDLTITKSVQPLWLANQSFISAMNAAGSARYDFAGLTSGNVWSVDPDGRNVTFGLSIIANNNATNKVRIGASSDTTYPGIWFGDGAASPSLSNYSFLYDESVDTTILNAPLVIDFRIANAAAWTINASKHLLVSATDNTLDIGASGANRPRTGYFGTSIIAPVGTFATSISIAGGTALTTTNQTGTGDLVLATSPTLVTPVLGVATGTTLALTLADAATNTADTILTLSHTTSGAAAANFGAAILTQLEAGSGTLRSATRQYSYWSDPTDATPDAAIKFETAVDNVLTETVRFDYVNGATFTSAGTPVVYTRVLAAASGLQGAAQFGLSGFNGVAADGVSMLFFLPNGAGTKSFVGRVSGVWEVPTAGSETGCVTINVRANTGDTTAATEAARFNSASSFLMGTTTNDGSAIANFTSTTRGVLFPRMTTTQRDNISSPTDGLVIYNSTTSKFQGRAGAAWVDFH
jgi:hypothetical protein